MSAPREVCEAPRNILVAGGTGFIGSRIVQRLLEQYPEARIRVLSRRAQVANVWGRRVEHVQANICTTPTLRSALAGIDAVVQCAQFPNHPVENPEKGWTYMQVDAGGTRNLVDNTRECGGRRFVYLSMAGIENRGDSWAVAKARAENTVRGSGLEYMILRPTWVYGRGNPWIARYLRAVRFLPMAPIPGDGSLRTRPVSVSDVAQSVAAAFSTQNWNVCLDLAGPDELTLREVIKNLLRTRGIRRPLVPVPIQIWKVVAGLASMLPGQPLSPQVVDWMLREVPADPRRTEDVLGIRFREFERGIRLD